MTLERGVTMYFAMDEIGFENAEEIKKISSEPDRWQFIYNTAAAFGFEGVHFTPSLYETLCLDLGNIPDYFQDFKLTFHLGGLHKITSKSHLDAFNRGLEAAFAIAAKHNMHDISIHPPDTYELAAHEKEICLEFFRKALEKWLKTAIEMGISFSLETHVSGEFFLFNGLVEYTEFVKDYPGLGILIDISHNFYDRYTEDEIIGLLDGKHVKGLHISDALQGVDFVKGTHLAVGKGKVDFGKILNVFGKIPNLFCPLEIKASNEDIANSLKILRQL